MSKWIPDRKVLSGGIAGIATWLILLTASAMGYPLVEPGAEEGVAGVVGFVIAYIVPPSVRDVVKRIDARIRETLGLGEPPTGIGA